MSITSAETRPTVPNETLKGWQILLSERIRDENFPGSGSYYLPQKYFSSSGSFSPSYRDIRELLNIFQIEITKTKGQITAEASEPIEFEWPTEKDKGKPLFILEILSAIDIEPVEDGFEHPAENLLKEALLSHPRETIDWFYELISEENNTAVVASILKCIGRMEVGMCEEWGFDLVRKALQHKDVEVRDAAVQVLESWGTEKAIRLLKEHHDDVSWLQDYIDRVARDLEQSQKEKHGMACQKNIQSKMGA